MLRIAVIACALVSATMALACSSFVPTDCADERRMEEANRRFDAYVASIPDQVAARRAERERAIDQQHMNDTLDQMNVFGRRY